MRECIIIAKQDNLHCAILVNHQVVQLDELIYSQNALQAWLSQLNVKTVRIIVDLLEEELYIDKYPKLFSWEKVPFSMRQLKKRFPATEFCRVEFESVSGALPWQASDGNLLMMGFNEDQLLRSLLKWLAEAGVAVFSIHSTMNILKQAFYDIWFPQRKQQQLLMTQAMLLLVRVSEDDFRQLLLVDGKVRTSRQLHMNEADKPKQFAWLLSEVRLLDKFVRAQRMIAHDLKLKVFYLGSHNDDMQAAQQVLCGSEYLTQQETSHCVSIQSIIYDLSAHGYERLQLLTLSNHRVLPDYLPAVVKKTRSVHQLSQASWFVAFAVCMLLLAYVANHLVEEHEIDNTMQALTTKSQQYEHYLQRYSVQNNLGDLNNIPVEQIKSAVDLVEGLQQVSQTQTLLPIMEMVSRVLQQQDDVTLLEANFASQPNKVANKGKVLLDAPINQVELSLALIVNSKMRLSTMIQRMDSIADALKAADASIVSVVLTERPIDLASSHELKVTADDSQTIHEMPLPFKLMLVVKSNE